MELWVRNRLLGWSLYTGDYFYTTFILCDSEIATMIPHAGGPSAYARRAMGPIVKNFAGIGCLFEFLFVSPVCGFAGWWIHP